MAVDSSEILVGANGSVHVAPTGTTLPTDADEVLDDAFVDLGYVNENGVALADTKTVEPIPVWQAFYPVRRIVTDRDFTATFALAQWNKDTVKLAFGGGDVTSPGAGQYKYTPPDPEDRDERALVVEWQDGTKNYRLVVPVCEITDAVNTNVVRTDNAELPVTLGVNGSDAEAPWLLYTDDPAFS